MTKILLGAIVGLGMYINGWSVEVCMENFERLAKFAFQPRYLAIFRLISARLPFLRLRSKGLRFLPLLPKFSLPRLFSKIFGILMSIATDSVYSSRNLEIALQEAYTATRGILDYSHASAIGTKIGITVSSMEPKTSIFNNYNSQGNYRNGSYGVMQGNAPVWEM